MYEIEKLQQKHIERKILFFYTKLSIDSVYVSFSFSRKYTYHTENE